MAATIEPSTTESQVTIDQLCTQIRILSHADFDEQAAFALVEAIKDRLQVSNFKHMDHAISSIESLEDAATILWCAIEDMKAENA